MTNDILASVALKVDSAQAVAQLDRFGGRIDNVKAAVGSLSGAVASLFVGSKLATRVGKLLNDASEAQEVFGKFEAVFEGVQTQADEAASRLNKAFNFDLTSAQNSLSTMADIFHKSGLSIQESLKYAADLNERAADVEAFTNASGGLTQVTEAFTGAMLGFGMSAQRLGVVVKDETVEEQRAKEAREGLRFESERAAKMHARYSVILQQSASAAGQVARESDNYANRVRRLKADLADLSGNLGGVFIAPATKITTALNKVVSALNGMNEKARSALVVATTFGAVVATLTPAVLTLVGALKTYRNIGAIASAQTAQATGTTAGNTAAELANAQASTAATAAKERQIAATNANAAAIARETVALNANIHAVEKSAFASTLSSGGYRSRLSGRGAEIASGMKAAPVVMPLKGAFKNPFASLGKSLEGLIPVGGKVGLVLKGLTRFLGPVAAVWGALEALKNAPLLLEKALDFLPVIKTKTIDLARKFGALIVKYTPVVIEYVKDLFVGAIKGAASLQKRLQGLFVNNVIVPLLDKIPLIGGKIAGAAKRAFPAETEFSKQYELEKQLAKRRQETAQATQAATDAEKAAQDAISKRADAFNQYAQNATSIEDSYLTDDERKKRETIQAARQRVDDAQNKLDALTLPSGGASTFDISEFARAQGEQQAARIDLAKVENNEAQKTAISELAKQFESAINASTTNDERQKAVDEAREGIAALKNQSQQAARQAQQYNARAARFQTQADRYGQTPRGFQFQAQANEESTKARIATSQTLSGENLDALKELERQTKETLDEISSDVKARASFDYQKSIDALQDAQEQDLNEQARLMRQRAEAVEKGLASATSEQERLAIEQEVYALNRDASAKEKEALENDKASAKRRADYFANFALENAKTTQDKLSVLNGIFQRADSSFDDATNDDERYSALDNMRAAMSSIDDFVKDRDERLKKSVSTPIDPQQALTSGSTAAFKIENRMRNVWQDKLLSTNVSSNRALGRIYARLGEISDKSANRNETTELEIV